MKPRRLEPHEIAHAREIFGEAIDYGAVRITRGSMLATFSATATGNRINLQPAHFIGETLSLSHLGMNVLIHELAHVWQYQTSGFRYIGSSLGAQVVAWARTGSRRGAYDWRGALHRPWARWNAEQQAQCVSDYNDAFRRLRAGNERPADAATLAIVLPLMVRCFAGGEASNHGQQARSHKPSPFEASQRDAPQDEAQGANANS